MTTCPTCSRPVDPLRARAVGVRDGKVVAYCSAECAAKADASKPNVAPPPPPRTTPPKGVPTPPKGTRSATPASGTPRGIRDFDSGPVIEILHEPASGVVTSARDERVATGPVPKVIADEVAAKSAPAVVVEAPFTPDADEDDDEDDEAPDDAADKDAAEPQPGMRTLRQRRDSMNAKAAWDWLDDEPAEHVRAGTSAEKARGGFKGPLIFLLVLALVGAGGVLVYKYLYLSRGAAAVHASEPPGMHVASGSAVEAAPPVAVAPVVDVKTTVDHALAILRANLETGVPRVQRKAAAALARTGDKAALDLLAAAVAKETGAGKLELAYELARGGDKRGSEALVAALGSAIRSDKLDAGTDLARLGDQRAVAIASYLDVSQNRLSVAIELARINEPHALKALEQIRADAKASPDEKARAAIGLGLAGRTDVAEALHALLDDTRSNVDAAEALSVLHDEAARPALVKMLAISSLQVRAARALRRLSDTFDAAPHVKLLVDRLDALDKTQDTEQIDLAEAILLLGGEASWSEHR